VIAKDPIEPRIEPPTEPRIAAPTEPRIAAPTEPRIALEEVPCPLGCAAGDRLVLEGFDRLQGLPGRYRVVECASCGLLRTNPRPTPESMSFYYGAGYLPYHSSRPRARLGAELVDRLLLVEAVPPLPPGSMLEVGCASGGFLRRMARRGWRVTGIERSEEAAGACAALGYRVHAGTLETAPDGCGEFDLVAAWMVLEHLHDPVGGLEKLHAWTKPGGWLALSVPNAACRERRWFGDAWFPLHLPNHLFHFTPATLRRTLERAGWEVQRIALQRHLGDLIASAGYVLQDRRRLPALSRLLVSWPWRGGRLNLALLPLSYPSSLLGQTARMTAWARKARTGGGADAR
jgi:SAM-dependent methyltransferase